MSRTAEDWGRLAVSLPGWRWTPGMVFGSLYAHGMNVRVQAHDITTDTDAPDAYWFFPESPPSDAWPDPDDPATAGCLLALLGPLGLVMDALSKAGRMDIWSALMRALMHDPPALGRACIAAAKPLGRWPNGGRMEAE